MLRFTLKVKNAEKIDFALTGLVAKIQDWRGVWPSVAEYLRQTEAELFETQGAIGAHGERAPLDPKYAARKEREYPGTRILVASGRLHASLTMAGTDHIEEFEPRAFRFGTTVPYALYHQMGYRKRGGKGTVPARRVMDLSELDSRQIQNIMQRESRNFARRLGFAVATKQLPGVEISGTEALHVSLGQMMIPLSEGI